MPSRENGEMRAFVWLDSACCSVSERTICMIYCRINRHSLSWRDLRLNTGPFMNLKLILQGQRSFMYWQNTAFTSQSVCKACVLLRENKLSIFTDQLFSQIVMRQLERKVFSHFCLCFRRLNGWKTKRLLTLRMTGTFTSPSTTTWSSNRPVCPTPPTTHAWLRTSWPSGEAPQRPS